MKKVFGLFVCGAMTALGADHGQVVKNILDSAKVKNVEVEKGNAKIDLIRVEMDLNERLAAAQAQSTAYHADKSWTPPPWSDELDNLSITFGELADIPDDATVKLSGKVFLYAPQHSLNGVRICFKNGKYIHEEHLQDTVLTPIIFRGQLLPRPMIYIGNRLEAEEYVRWGDIKDRVAIEHTPRRDAELQAMKDQVYARR